MKQPGRFKDKVAIVTGGASGIGEATALQFAREEAAVVLADIDAERGMALESRWRGMGLEVRFVETRVEKAAACDALAAAALSFFGRIDVLVNNAAMRRYGTVLETTDASWDDILGVNVKGYANCARAVIPAMAKAGGGAIVNVASIRSVISGKGMVEYNTTKAAIVGLTGSLANDHASQGVRVNTVSPGPVFTRFHEERAHEAGMTPEAFKKEFSRHGMLQRPADPDEIANCILFLCSSQASYVTGANLMVDGGITAMDHTV